MCPRPNLKGWLTAVALALALLLATSCDTSRPEQTTSTAEVEPETVLEGDSPYGDAVFPYVEETPEGLKWGLRSLSKVLVSAQYQYLQKSDIEGTYEAGKDTMNSLLDSRGSQLLEAPSDVFYQMKVAYFEQNHAMPYYDDQLKAMGYRMDNQVVLPAIYKNAMPFLDDFAVVQASEDEALSTVIDKEGKVLFADQSVQLINLGQGYIAAIDELYAYQDQYFKKRILTNLRATTTNSGDKNYPQGAYYTLLPLVTGNFFVSDGVTGHFVDGNENPLPGASQLEGYQFYDLVGPLIRAYASEYGHLKLAYYTPQGDRLWSYESPESTKDMGDGVVVTHVKPHITRFETNLPILVAIPNNLEAEREINNITAGIATDPEDFEASQMVTSTAYGLEKNGSILTLSINAYTYAIGAAHPSAAVEYRHYDLKTNRWFQLKDLFTDEGKGLTLVSEQILAEIEASDQAQDFWTEEGIHIRPDHAFTFIDGGIEVLFQQYEIGPYAMGMPSFQVAYGDLEPYLNKDNLSIRALFKD